MSSFSLMSPDIAQALAQKKLNSVFSAYKSISPTLPLLENQTEESIEVRAALNRMAANFVNFEFAIYSAASSLRRQAMAAQAKGRPVKLRLLYTQIHSLCLQAVKPDGAHSVLLRISRKEWKLPAIPASARLSRAQRNAYHRAHQEFVLNTIHKMVYVCLQGFQVEIESWVGLTPDGFAPICAKTLAVAELSQQVAAIRNNEFDSIGVSFKEQAVLLENQYAIYATYRESLGAIA